MAAGKGGSSGCNGRDSAGKRLGVKCFDGQAVKAGSIITRQRGTKLLPGANVKRGRDDTLFALKPGILRFEKNRKYVRVEESAKSN